MPELALAPAAPAPSATSAIPGSATGSDAAAGATQGSPFANLLQEHLAAQILVPVSEFAGLPAAEPAADVPADATDDAMLPLLLGLADQSAAPGIAALPAPIVPVTLADTAVPTLTPEAPAAAVSVALPATSTRLPTETPQKVGAGDTPAGFAAATSGNKPSAIVAASATERGNGTQIALAAAKGEATLATVGAETPAPRAEALPQFQVPPARAAEQAVRIEAAVGTRQWDGEFANRVTWMVGRQEQRAALVLNPPQLGRIEVSLSVSGDQATAIFTSASATVRDAIENALPRLRETLQESGINLGQTQVGAESRQQSPTHDENRDNRGNAVAADLDARALPAGFGTNSATAWLSSGRGIIDVFA